MSHIKLPIIDSLTRTLQNRPSSSKSQYPKIFSDSFSKISKIKKSNHKNQSNYKNQKKNFKSIKYIILK